MEREWRPIFHQHPGPRAKLIDQVDGISVEFVCSRHADHKRQTQPEVQTQLFALANDHWTTVRNRALVARRQRR